MCINGKFDFYLTDIQATSYHHSVGSICKWTMLNFFPFVSPHSFVVRAINYRLLFCILYTFILWYKECNRRERAIATEWGALFVTTTPTILFPVSKRTPSPNQALPSLQYVTRQCLLVRYSTVHSGCEHHSPFSLFSLVMQHQFQKCLCLFTAWTAQFYSKVHL